MLRFVAYMQPKDFFESPRLFGDISSRLKPEFDVAEHEQLHEIHAALMQNTIAYSVESILKVEGRIKGKVAENAGMIPKRLYRILNGETWIKMPDITGLSGALGVNLISIAEYHGKQPVTSWSPLTGTSLRANQRNKGAE